MPCRQPAIKDTSIKRTVVNSPPKTNYRHLTEINSRYHGLSLMRTLTRGSYWPFWRPICFFLEKKKSQRIFLLLDYWKCLKFNSVDVTKPQNKVFSVIEAPPFRSSKLTELAQPRSQGFSAFAVRIFSGDSLNFKYWSHSTGYRKSLLFIEWIITIIIIIIIKKWNFNSNIGNNLFS